MDLIQIKESKIWLWTIVVTVALTILQMNSPDLIINIDGVLYLKVANVFLNKGILAAKQVHSMPLYSILIGLISSALGFTLEHSAKLLNAFLFITSAFYFIKIATFDVADNKKRVQWWAFILFFGFHNLVSDLHLIIRDHAYWALNLASLFYLISYSKSKSKTIRNSVLAGTLSFFSMFFRSEGIFYFIAVLTTIFIQTSFFSRIKQGKAKLILFYFSVLSVIAVAFVISIFHYIHQTGYMPDSKITWVFDYLSSRMLHSYNVLKPNLDYPSAVNFLTFLSSVSIYFLYSIFHSLGLLYFVIILFFASKFKSELFSFFRKEIWIFLLVNLIFVFPFLIFNLFLSSRYLIEMSLVFLTQLPFFIDRLHVLSLESKPKKVLYALFLTALLLNGVSAAIKFGNQRHYLHQGAAWVAENLAGKPTCYTNDSVMYYAKQVEGFSNGSVMPNTRKVSLDEIKNVFPKHLEIVCAYYVTSYHKSDEQVKALFAFRKVKYYKEIKRFSNSRNDILAIYKTKRD